MHIQQFNNLIMSNANFLTATAAGEPAGAGGWAAAVGGPTARHNSATYNAKHRAGGGERRQVKERVQCT